MASRIPIGQLQEIGDAPMEVRNASKSRKTPFVSLILVGESDNTGKSPLQHLNGDFSVLFSHIHLEIHVRGQ